MAKRKNLFLFTCSNQVTHQRTGATRTVFIFQVITTIAYLFCLWGLGYCNVTLAAYWAVEYLYVILLGTQSVIYLKYKQY